MVGDTYTQVLSGLSDGQSVVLADYAEAVPSSNTDLTNALGGGGGFGGGGGGFGGGGSAVPAAASARQRCRRRRRGSPSAAEPSAATTDASAHAAAGRYGGHVAAIRLDQVNLVVHDVDRRAAPSTPGSASTSVTCRPGLGRPSRLGPSRRAHSPRRGPRQRDVRRQVELGRVRRQRGHPRLQGGRPGTRSTLWSPPWSPRAWPCSRSPTTPSGAPATPWSATPTATASAS